MNIERLSTPQRISAVAMVVVILAAFLPWVSLFGISALGVQGDGLISLVLALVGLVVLVISSGLFGAARIPGRGSRITLIVLSILTTLVPLFDLSGLSAIGMYLTLFAGIAWIVGAIWAMSSAKKPAAPKINTP